ncbi:hypothetical protein H0H92_007012, partial [Tricholoma furcatifolium]
MHRTASFSAILQAAAGRAWVRSASSIPARSAPKPLVKPPDNALVQYLRRNEDSQVSPRPSPTLPFAAYFDPDAISDSDLSPHMVDPSRSSEQVGSSEPSWYLDDASIVGTTVGLGAHPAFSTRFPLSKTPASLYQNLLRLLQNYDPPPALTTLVDYHDLHSGLRSTRSYNLLLSLAIRHSSYGTVKWLLAAMCADRLPGNLETWKLRIRWLVQSGMWDTAWNEAMTMSRNPTGMSQAEKATFKTNALPFPIWMEFFRTLKRGADLPRRKTLPVTPPLEPIPSESDLYSTRYHTLMNNRPTILPHQLYQTPPRTLYHAVWIMLHVGQVETALTLTKSYLAQLPPSISVSWYRVCLDILHLFIAKGSSQKGLRRLFETRRMMVSLLSVYPTLRPTSTTLFLLLSALFRAKRCGTVAVNTLRAFKSRYGPQTEDRRVRRRVISLALKEGRDDIVSEMLR